ATLAVRSGALATAFLESRYRNRIRAVPLAIAFVTRTGVSFGGVAGGPQASDAEGAADEPPDPHAAATRASRTRSGSQRRGVIGDRVSRAAGRRRPGRMGAS